MFRRIDLIALALLLTSAADVEAGPRTTDRRVPLPVNPATHGSITFSNLVLRAQRSGKIELAQGGYGVLILEELRKYGHRALGAEDLVFGKDRSGEARFVLGGTVTELECRKVSYRLNCGVAVRWQVLDQRAGEVVYEMTARHRELGMVPSSSELKSLDEALLLGALRSLLARPRFLQALRGADGARRGGQTLPRRKFRACGESWFSLPADSERALDASVFVESDGRSGSGVLISPDGLVVTAAHVVAGERVKIRLRNGVEHTATVLRRNESTDVALLSLPMAQTSCMSLRVGAPTRSPC